MDTTYTSSEIVVLLKDTEPETETLKKYTKIFWKIAPWIFNNTGFFEFLLLNNFH